MKSNIIILIFAMAISSCSENTDTLELSADAETDKVDKIIFGGVYGMCAGDCRDLYLLTPKGLYKDTDNTTDSYGEWKETSFAQESDQEKFDKVSDLLDVPPSLLQESPTSEELIVQSWADVDYYLYIEKNGKSRELIFDHIHENASPEIKEYFYKFLKNYKELGGYIIDTTDIDRYY